MSIIPTNQEPEFWLSGTIPGIPFLLQPAAHALLQSRRELDQYTKDFPEALLWEKLSGRASAGFHIQHLNVKVEEALGYFKTIDEKELKEVRTVGRKKLPSTVLGLLFHAAEHSQRHIGQLLVTVSVLQQK